MRERGSTIIIIAQRLGILNLSDKVLVLDNGMMNAFGKRREVAEKIRSGRTVIPVRSPQFIAEQKVVLGHPTKSPRESPPPVIARGPDAEENARGHVHERCERLHQHDRA